MRNSIPMNTKPTLPPHTWKCSCKRSPTYSRVSLLFMSCCSDKIWQSSGKTHCWLNVWWSGFISGFNPKEYQMGASTCTCWKWINLWKWVLCSFWCPQVRLSRRWWLRRYWRCDVLGKRRHVGWKQAPSLSESLKRWECAHSDSVYLFSVSSSVFITGVLRSSPTVVIHWRSFPRDKAQFHSRLSFITLILAQGENHQVWFVHLWMFVWALCIR